MFLVLAAIGLAACTNDDLGGDNGPAHSGEIEESYIAINLSAAGGTRAQDGFDDGTAEERAVSHADFFFFDEEGDPFPVQVNNPNDGTTSAPGGNVNCLRAVNIEFDEDTNAGDDISDSSNAVLLLKTYKGQYPSQIVAVLNWSPGNNPSYSLVQLHDAVNLTAEYEGTNYFVMSNAVYAQGTTPVYATPLTIENIKTSESDALNAPVTIYVERVAAKVNVQAANGVTDGKFELADKKLDYVLNGTTHTQEQVYAKILGWDLYRDNTQSKLLKEIDGTWTVDELGFNWNDTPWYRSYWATSLAAPTNDPVFDAENLPNDGDGFALGTSVYIGENTTGKATCTKVVIKAQLQNASGDNLELAIWNNVQYVGNLALRTAVANTLKHTYFAKADGKYTGLTPEDLECVGGDTAGAPANVEANEVYFQLSDAADNKDWYKLVNGEHIPVANDTANDIGSVNATNEALKSVPEALLYANGQTFYYVDIRHLAPELGKTGSYGIVRNHVYNITINSIGGYGSPVYTGVSYLEYPDITEQDSYVSAKINILSWKLVDQTVNIQPGN